MATFDIYDAGGSTEAPHQYPSAPITATQDLGMIGNGPFPTSRAFDLRAPLASSAADRPRSNRGLIAALAARGPLVAGDKIGMLVIPKRTRLENVTVEVLNPVAGVTFSLAGRFTAQAIGTTINAATATSVSTDIAAAALKFNDTQNEVLEVTLATVPTGGLGELAFVVSANTTPVNIGG